MTNSKKHKPFKTAQLLYYTIGVILVWSLFMGLLMVLNYKTEKSVTLEAAKIQARAAFEKDVLYRRWNAGHGGVYAPVTKTTPSNPYLDVLERDIQTPSGENLTLVNPAYMTRQVHELAKKTQGVKGHITSLKPIRPENAPDEWETRVLKAFEKGEKEVSSKERMDGQDYLRLMQPLIAEKGCLKCHAKQGYKLGEIRGGISVSVPWSPLAAIERASLRTAFLINGLIWLAGIIGIALGMYFLNRQIRHRLEAEKARHEQVKLQGIIEMSGAVCHELNQPLQTISGNAEILMMKIPENDPHYQKITTIKKQVDRMGEITKKLMGITRYKTRDYPDGRIIDVDKASR